MKTSKEFIKNTGYLASISGIILFISCSGGSVNASSSSIIEKSKEAAANTKDAMKSAANDVKEMSEEAIDNVAEVATDTKDSMRKSAETGMDKAKVMATKTEKAIEKTANKTEDMLEKAASKTKEIATKSSNAVANRTEAVVESVAKAIPVKTSSNAPSQSSTSSIKTPTSMPSASNNSKPATDVKEKMNSKVKETTKTVQKVITGVDHSTFDKLLKAHVSSTGVVDYAGFKSDASKLDSYIATLNENPIQSNWSKDEQLAYWINAYNAHTIKLILDNYPVKSIKDINGGKPWDKQWIKLGGKTYSLNNIENDIIRPTFNEPRIHFAVNCAAESCPPLHNGAWTASNLESNLELSTKKFINNSKYNQISASGASISSIFDWYGGDFGDVKAFLNRYSNTKLDSSSKISYSDYNWNLNGK